MTVKKFRPDFDEATTDSLVQFSKKVLAEKAEEFFVSEEVLDDWNKGPVKVLVSKNFNEVAFDESKKVFVHFHMPGSQNNYFEPIVKQLGEKYKGSDDVIVVKMDYSLNDAEDFVVESAFVLFQSGPEGTAVTK